MKRLVRWTRRLAVAASLGLFALGTLPSQAHLATWGSWAVTHRNLMKLFPGAAPDGWKIKKYRYSDAEVAQLEQALGFELYPEDKAPQFYIAHDGDGALLGVSIFIDPRTKPKVLDGGVLTLEVGIGVDSHGRVSRIKVYDYRGSIALTEPKFLDQFRGRDLNDSFKMGQDGLTAVQGEEEESQLIANAAREALLLMKVALGRRTPAQ